MSKINKMILLGGVTVAFLATGCAQKNTTNLPYNCKTAEDCAKIAQQKDEKLKMTEQTLSKKDAEIAKLQQQLQEKSQTTEQNSNNNQNNIVRLPNSGLILPPNAKAGQCFAKVVLPPKYENKKIKVLVDAGGVVTKTIPAKYRTVEKKVLVREATKKIITIPPVYKTVTEKVEVKPETVKEVIVKPAEYKYVTEKVLVEPEHTKWVRGSLLHNKKENLNVLDKTYNPSVGDVMCLVKVPAKYKTVTKKVMVHPPVIKKIVVPAQYKTVTQRVVVKPAETKTVEIPAVYKTVKVKELVQPQQVVEEKIPAKYKWVTERIKVKDILYKIEPVVCKTNLTPDLVINLQKKLKKLGYYTGPIDGIYGPLTAKAVDAYQKDKGYARGALTVSTLESLGIKYNGIK